MDMKKSMISKLFAVCILSVFTLLSAVNPAFANESSPAQIELVRILKLYIDPTQVNDELLAMYASDDWSYDGSAFVKRVKYTDEVIMVDGNELSQNAQGNFDIPLEEDSIQKNIGIKIDGVNFEDRIVTLQKNQVTTIESVINVNELQNNMDSHSHSEEENVGTTSIGQDNGELPKNNDIVACNRFNGYQGNGRYYSNEASTQAVKNFFQSDCDVALAKSVQCLRDHGPASWRYCSLVSKSNYGQCSKMSSHSTTYHKHTSWFGPST